MNKLDVGNGKKEFMTFQAYEDVGFLNPKGSAYQVTINPEQFSKSMSALFEKKKGHKYSVSAGKFSSMQPIDYNFTLMLDGTGVIPSQRIRESVQEQLSKITDVFFKTGSKGKGYEPNYVAITFCDEIFHCVISSFKTDYTLFNPDGSPLRAKVTCAFKSICSREPNLKPKRKYQ